MKTVLIIMCLSLLVGCSSVSTVCEFDKEGNLIKKTESDTSAINEAILSAKGKSIAMWSTGWCAKLVAVVATPDNPSPQFHVEAGNIETGYISILPTQKNLDGMAEVINAVRDGNLEISATGITNNKSNITENEDK
jgi:hypothetical protein